MGRKLAKDNFYQEYIRGRWLEHHGYRFNADKLIDELIEAGYGERTERGFQFGKVEPDPLHLNHMMRDHGLMRAESFRSDYLGAPSAKEIREVSQKFGVAALLFSVSFGYLYLAGFFTFMHSVFSKFW